MQREHWLGSLMLVSGLAIAGLAANDILRPHVTLAQVAPSSPANEAPVGKGISPSPQQPGSGESTPLAPEPARPDATTTGSSPPTTQDRPPVTGNPLPPAPAETTGEPIKSK